MLRRILSWFAWRIVHQAGGWEYEENILTGQRSAWYRADGGYQPLDLDWLMDGKGDPVVDGKVWREGVR